MAQRRGTKALAISVTIAQVCALLRYTALARLLGPHELGLAVSVILVQQFFDAITESGNDRFLVQNRDGDDPEAQAMVHMAAIGRGLFLGAAFIGFGWAIAWAMDLPAIAAGLTLLGFAPFIAGFVHLDMRRVQRDNDFRPEARALLFAEPASTIATVISAILLHSYIASVIGVVVRAIVLTGMSHFGAQRPYRVKFSKTYAPQLFAFGLPLMINGLLLFANSQSDRVIVGTTLGLAALGQYSAVALLAYYPMSVTQRFIGSLFLPLVASASPTREANARLLGSVSLLLGCGIVAGFAVVAPFAVHLFFGARYVLGWFDIALIGILNAARFQRHLWPTTLALGNGESKVVLGGNAVQMIGVALAIGLGFAFPSLAAVIIGMLVGEILGLAAPLWMLSRTTGVRKREWMARVGMFILFAAAIGATGWAVEFGNRVEIIAASIISIMMIGALCLFDRLALSQFVQQAMQVLRRRKSAA